MCPGKVLGRGVGAVPAPGRYSGRSPARCPTGSPGTCLRRPHRALLPLGSAVRAVTAGSRRPAGLRDAAGRPPAGPEEADEQRGRYRADPAVSPPAFGLPSAL